MSRLISPTLLLLRNLTQFCDPTLIFFQSLILCRSPLDLVFLLVFLQEQVPLVLASLLCSKLLSTLVLPCAWVPSVLLPCRSLCPAAPTTLRRLDVTAPVHTCLKRSSQWPLLLAHPRHLDVGLSSRPSTSITAPACTCPNRLGRWSLLLARSHLWTPL
jgi:hypothetical protein